MKIEELELVRGSGNAFRDLGLPNPDVAQLKAVLAAEIIKQLDREGLTVRVAQARTGIAAADFSRIRNANLRRFTVDRLISALNGLGSQVEVAVTVKPNGKAFSSQEKESVETAEAFFKRRSQGSDKVDFLEILRNAPDRAPDRGDERR
jgi:predicted XRE-type DNA-binding protein